VDLGGGGGGIVLLDSSLNFFGVFLNVGEQLSYELFSRSHGLRRQGEPFISFVVCHSNGTIW
jgi:hypothetical protein